MAACEEIAGRYAKFAHRAETCGVSEELIVQWRREAEASPRQMMDFLDDKLHEYVRGKMTSPTDLWWATPDIATHGARCEAAKAEALALGVTEEQFNSWVQKYRSTFDKGGQRMTAFLRIKLDEYKEGTTSKSSRNDGPLAYRVTTYDVYLMACRLLKERPIGFDKPWKQHWDTMKRSKDGCCRGCGSFNGHDKDCPLDLENVR